MKDLRPEVGKQLLTNIDELVNHTVFIEVEKPIWYAPNLALGLVLQAFFSAVDFLLYPSLNQNFLVIEVSIVGFSYSEECYGVGVWTGIDDRVHFWHLRFRF